MHRTEFIPFEAKAHGWHFALSSLLDIVWIARALV
jgi:hypothetical protein